MKRSRFLFALWVFVVISFFTFQNATIVSSPPVALSPYGYLSPGALTFQWQADPTATTYDFQLLESSTGQTVYDAPDTSGTSLTLPNTVTVSNGVKYTWMVRSQYSSTSFSDWSNAWDFIVFDPAFIPSPLQPQAYITNLSPTFSWSAVAGADSYNVELTDSNGNLIQTIADVSSTNAVLPNTVTLMYNVAYNWQVQAVDTDGNPGRWSDPVSFMAYDQVLVPTTIAPTAYISDLNPTFSWSAIGAAVSYEVQIVNQATSVVYDTTATTNALNYQVQLGQVYQWRVRANTSTDTGMWSAWNSFAVYDGGFVPTPSAPNGNGASLTPTFTWSAISSAVAYEIEVLSGPQIVYQGSSTTTSVNFVNGFKLVGKTTYTWHVRAVNAVPQTSDWSAPMTFSTSDPSLIPTTTSPVGTVLTLTPSFVWAKIKTGVSSYSVEVLDSNGTVVVSGQVDAPKATLKSKVELTNYANYKWHVRAIGFDGTVNPWSPDANFSIDVGIQSIKPTGLASASQKKNRAAVLSWNRVVGADHYLVIFHRVGEDYEHMGKKKDDPKRIKIISAGTSFSVDDTMTDSGYTVVTVRAVDSRGVQSRHSAPITLNLD